MKTRLTHDISHNIATSLLEIIKSCIREEEHKDAWGEFYRVVHAGLETYEALVQRQEKRLHPKN